jgi:ribosomal protein S18 acetylase RimI-like enzyme
MSRFATGHSVLPPRPAAVESHAAADDHVPSLIVRRASVLPRHTQTLQMWGFDLCAELPKKLSNDAILAVPGDFNRIGKFLEENYGLFSEEQQGAAPSAAIQKSKLAYLSNSCDLIELRHNGETVGVLIGAPEDWSSYYVRMFAVRPEYQRPSLIRRFVRECVFEPLIRGGVERVVAETSPANIAMSHLFTELRFRVTGNLLSDRWGPLVRYTKFLAPACEAEFLRKFGGAAPRKSEQPEKEDPQ